MAESKDRYYIGSEEILLTDEASNEKLVQRLRQYLGLRHVSFLIGNGASLPLGSPAINSVRAIEPELKKSPYSLESKDDQKLAMSLLDILLPKPTDTLGVESLLALVQRTDTHK